MTRPSVQSYRATAKAIYQDDGVVEIDKFAPVSQAPGNPDNGAYVQAWVWVDDVTCDTDFGD